MWHSFKNISDNGSKFEHKSKVNFSNDTYKGKTSKLGNSSRLFPSKSLTMSGKQVQSFSEFQRHSIKTSFQAIEGLWRDLSLGTDLISMSRLSLIHENLGEIGSELFKKLFLADSDQNQVCFGCLPYPFYDLVILYLDARQH